MDPAYMPVLIHSNHSELVNVRNRISDSIEAEVGLWHDLPEETTVRNEADTSTDSVKGSNASHRTRKP